MKIWYDLSECYALYLKSEGMIFMDKKPKEENKNASYVGVGIALGAGIGTAVGVAMDEIAMGVAFGSAFGVVLGAVLTNMNHGKK